MIKLNGAVTDGMDFFMGASPLELLHSYGSPLYVYNERILRKNCRELMNMCAYKNFKVNFSAKANTNLALMQIVRSEGLDVDAMSVGEIHLELMAGFKPEQILFIPNNVSADEMRYAIDKGIKVSVDSLAQLEMYGKINPGGSVVIRFNAGVGAGHHEKVVTAGKSTKFGVNAELVPDVKRILKAYDLKLIGINQHIGSLFMSGENYVKGASNLLAIAKQFEGLEFIDLGGGFGIPYHKQDGEARLDLNDLGARMTEYMETFSREYGKELEFKVEPGRYVPAEAGVLLGTVHAVKYNDKKKFIGTDLGFNVLARPVMYDSHHDIEVYRDGDASAAIPTKTETVTVVGNICESGDIIAKDRLLPEIFEGDALGVLDAGSYGHVMSSNYNCRLRPAEVLLCENGEAVLVRERDTFEDISRHMIGIL